MIDHPRCATCSHWSMDVYLGYVREDGFSRLIQSAARSGTCSRVNGYGDDRTAWLAGGDPDGADLDTRADHYCPMHSDLSPA